MAQPLSDTVPPICLAYFGTDNKFNTENILLRWKYIAQECSACGITMLSFGSDGDSRLMKDMKISSLNTNPTKPLVFHIPTCTSVNIPRSCQDWYHAKPSQICYVQDTVHIAVKLKSWLLNHRLYYSWVVSMPAVAIFRL